MPTNFSRELLSSALNDPRENLDVEIKNWLDLVGDNDAKANFAKAALALANNGGGMVILGMEETATGFRPAPNRPATLDGYAQDGINGIIHNYADPPFHCEVRLVPDAEGEIFPIVIVPGGHRIPLRAKRAGPHGNIVRNNAIYIRRPGPASEEPQSAQDWDGLMARCLANRRDEMFDQIRAVIHGAVPAVAGPPEPGRLDQWVEQSLARWATVVATVPADDPARFPHGFYWYAFELQGDLRPLPGAQFVEALRGAELNTSGWPPFFLPSVAPITPYPFEDAIECWMGGDRNASPTICGAAVSDFWRVSRQGLGFVMRGYREDDLREPGTLFDVAWPISIAGEILLYVESVARRMIEGAASATLVAQFTGLEGRRLTSIGHSHFIREYRQSRQDAVTLRTTIDVESIGSNLPEIVGPFLAPLYAPFDFFELPSTMIVEELGQIRTRS